MSDHPLTLATVDADRLRGLVEDLYRIFHDRAADPTGLDVYVAALTQGQPVAEVIEAFATSSEFLDRRRREVLIDMMAGGRLDRGDKPASQSTLEVGASRFPESYSPPGEAGRSYLHRLRSGFLDRYCGGPVVLDVGFSGYDNPERKSALPDAIGIDLDYPGYDGLRLPFADESVDTVFSSHCLEHVQYDHAVIRDWFRVLRTGGFIVCIVPSQALYEKRRFLPSRFNEDHKRMYSPTSLVRSFEEALEVNTYRVRHLAENDRGFNYTLGPETHSDGAYEIELVIEKITPPAWTLA